MRAALGGQNGLMWEDARDGVPGALTFAQFTEIVERNERELYLFLQGVVSDGEQARDLVQDTFYDAWRAAKRRRPPLLPDGPPEEIRRWLFHAAYCRAISARRKRRLLRFESLSRTDTAELEAIANLTSFEDQVAEHDALRTAVSSLAPEDAACLVLIVVQGFTAAEAAHILGSTPAAIAKRLARAKRRLLIAYTTTIACGENSHEE
jgi:RNA polymerase sigma-70 factor, ECF subfamily